MIKLFERTKFHYKIKLFAAIATFFALNSCEQKCDHTNCTKTVVEEKVVLKDPTVFSGKPKNIIFMIGDGMGLTQITSGLTRQKDFLQLARCKHIGFSKTQSGNKYITDSAAGATAFSIGKKSYNGAIGVDMDTIAHPTILEIAEKNGLSTGLVATSAITHATPASFISHQKHRDLGEAIALDFLKTDIDVFIGGGKAHFMARKDSLPLIDSLKNKGYSVALTADELATISGKKIAGLLADNGMPKMTENRGDFLKIASKIAISNLNENDKGFFLMIEGSQIDWGGHDMDAEYVVTEMVDFDQTVGQVLDFADKDGETLVIITADHETGGFALVNGDMEKGEIDGQFQLDHHTGTMVPVFAYGPGADAFMGMYHNTTIFDKMMGLFGFTKPATTQQ